MIYYNVTAYDGFGNVVKTYKAKSIGWYKHGGVNLILKGDIKTFLKMPSVVVEIPKTPYFFENCPSQLHPHEVTLYSLDGKIIKTWVSEYAPASPEFGTLFDTKDTHVEIHGPVIINKK